VEITLAPERLFLLEERLTIDEITQRAMDKRTSALGSLLSKPKPEEVTLVNKQRRLEPFWHVAGHAIYVYERQRDYSVPAASADVEALTILGTRYEGQAAAGSRAFRVPALEHLPMAPRSSRARVLKSPIQPRCRRVTPSRCRRRTVRPTSCAH
jgi:hypothetical protein